VMASLLRLQLPLGKCQASENMTRGVISARHAMAGFIWRLVKAGCSG
jgi:hypothetical protein